MKVLNVHSRILHCRPEELKLLLDTLASQDDRVWPIHVWPRMTFKQGVKIGSKGGHGPIRYIITKLVRGAMYQFQFTNPKGFDGHHRFEIDKLNKEGLKITHSIQMRLRGMAIIKWLMVIRPLHNALIEDLFDNIGNRLTGKQQRSEWSLWVKFLRKILS